MEHLATHNAAGRGTVVTVAYGVVAHSRAILWKLAMCDNLLPSCMRHMAYAY